MINGEAIVRRAAGQRVLTVFFSRGWKERSLVGEGVGVAFFARRRMGLEGGKFQS